MGGIWVGGYGERDCLGLQWVETGAYTIHHLAATGPLADMAIKA